jgi:hypothetical protein
VEQIAVQHHGYPLNVARATTSCFGVVVSRDHHSSHDGPSSSCACIRVVNLVVSQHRDGRLGRSSGLCLLLWGVLTDEVLAGSAWRHHPRRARWRAESPTTSHTLAQNPSNGRRPCVCVRACALDGTSHKPHIMHPHKKEHHGALNSPFTPPLKAGARARGGGCESSSGALDKYGGTDPFIVDLPSSCISHHHLLLLLHAAPIRHHHDKVRSCLHKRQHGLPKPLFPLLQHHNTHPTPPPKHPGHTHTQVLHPRRRRRRAAPQHLPPPFPPPPPPSPPAAAAPANAAGRATGTAKGGKRDRPSFTLRSRTVSRSSLPPHSHSSNPPPTTHSTSPSPGPTTSASRPAWPTPPPSPRSGWT